MANSIPADVKKQLLLCQQLLQTAREHEAAAICRRILMSHPDNGEAYLYLGVAACRSGQLGQGIRFLHKSMEIDPGNPVSYNEIGKAFTGRHQFAEAQAAFAKAVSLHPANAEFHQNLGNILKKLGKLPDAIAHYRQALTLRPGTAVLFNNLGNAYRESGSLDQAEAYYRKALVRKPDYALSWNNLGNIMLEKRSTREAVRYFRKALSLAPGYAVAYYNLGNALKFQGRLAEALASYRKALQLNPRNSGAHSLIVFIMNYCANFSQDDIYRESLQWAQQHANAFSAAGTEHAKGRAGRKLRIGYVSPDFRTHSVAYFIEPVMQAHDRDKFEVYCYANVKKPDEVTQRLSGQADQWRNIFGLGDNAAAKLIIKDRIDILVDLAGHTPNNRLLIFARRPAPVQLTWLGYPNTTGMAVLDYRLTDEVADPGQESGAFHSEQLLRLEHGFLCYRPEADAPAVEAAPCLEQGYVTFGSFNNLAKVNREVVELWAEILRQLPQSCLVIKSKPFADEDTRKDYLRLFEEKGIPAERLELHGWQPTKEGHLALYNRIDIGLDPFPYNGTTTTCEALWMGVPVITLRGKRHAGRVGASIMHQAGLEGLVAESEERYKELAIKLASDRSGLQSLRTGMRERLQRSALMNAPLFTKSLERMYGKIWSTWHQS